MSIDLEIIFNDIYNGYIPQDWKNLSPFTNKKLASWMTFTLKRIDQYNNWIKNGEPPVTWLSGIQIPFSYMIALS
jgi:dynein heavy chain